METRLIVEERAKGRCEYCQSPRSRTPDDYSVEHIMPRSRAGTDDLDNLAWSCQACNNRKHTAIQATDPQTGSPAPLYHPRLHSWGEHFRWSDDWLILIGQTPTGRATIARLDLNRDNVVSLREVLVPAGIHPPPDD